jgi:hypothetical protein
MCGSCPTLWRACRWSICVLLHVALLSTFDHSGTFSINTEMHWFPGQLDFNQDRHDVPSSLEHHAAKVAKTESEPGVEEAYRGLGLISPFPSNIESMSRELPQRFQHAPTCIYPNTHSCMENVCLCQRRQMAPRQAQLQVGTSCQFPAAGAALPARMRMFCYSQRDI